MFSMVSCLMRVSSGDKHFHRDAPRPLVPREPPRGVHQPCVVKEPCRLSLGHWHFALCIGHVEHKVQRPTQQLGQSPDRPSKAKCLETSHSHRVSLSNHLLIIAVGAFTGTASPIEIMPRLGATLH